MRRASHQPNSPAPRSPTAAISSSGPLLERPQQILGVAELLRDLHRAPAAAERDGRDR